MKLKSLMEKVVVITGASSGIGKLATEEFLKQGAKVVLSARSEEAMQQHLQELGVDDSRAIVVKTEVSDYVQMKALAQKAKEHFGHIDIWINNAAVSIYGTLQQLEPEEISRVIDVNLKGYIYGMKVAMEIFREQNFGNILNIASALGQGSAPLQSVYTATKHAIVGFSSCLREELLAQGKKDIEISVILPGSMDTPLFTHAKSKLGVKPYPIPPIYHPMVTVKKIIACAQDPQPEVAAGGFGRVMTISSRLMPRMLEKYQGKRGVDSQTTILPEPLEGQDNLFNPMPNTQTIRGEFGTTGEHIRSYPKRHPAHVAIALAVPLLFGYSLYKRRFA